VASTEYAGGYEPGAYILQLQKASSGAITRGVVVDVNTSTNVWRTAPTTGSAGKYGVCTKTAADGDLVVDVCLKGVVYLTADGVIQPGRRVQVSATTAGQVIQFADATVGGTYAEAEVEAAGANWNRSVGTYLGHVDENDGKFPPTASADGEVIRVLLD
jgi:hypothetical protein